MTEADKGLQFLPNIKRCSKLLVLFWSVLIGGLIAWSIWQECNDARDLVSNEARAHFLKDQAFRLWGSGHGGVYVPPTEKTQPNPHLSHIADRDIETASGKKLTLMNPAYMVRQLMEDYEEMYGIKGRITSLNFLRDGNRPDEWERAALESFELGAEEAKEFTDIDGEPFLRLMRPMPVVESCLKCHGYQGYNVGDVRGGVGVSVPAEPYYAAARAKIIQNSVVLGSIWLIGTSGICLGGRSLSVRILKQKEAEEEVRAKGEQLRVSNQQLRANEQERDKLVKTLKYKNKELQDVVYIASHDLKSPLINIVGFGGELNKACESLHGFVKNMDDMSSHSQIKETIENAIPESIGFIVSGVEKMKSLIDGLLRISRIGTVEISIADVNMNDLVAQIRSEMGFQIQEKTVSFEVDNLPGCRGDKEMLNQVFTNLIDNALKYREPCRETVIEVSGQVKGDEVVYCVSDNGKGVADDFQGRIFEIFHRLNPSDGIGGEGLGLTIVTRIVDRLGGRIWLESEAGVGSSFFVALPSGVISDKV